MYKIPELVPLVQYSQQDARRFYRGCTVLHDGEPWNFDDIDSDMVVKLSDDKDRSKHVPYTTLLIGHFPPFFSKDGDIIGFSVNRDPRRGYPHHTSLYEDLRRLIRSSSLETEFKKSSGCRLSEQYYVLPTATPTVYKVRYAIGNAVVGLYFYNENAFAVFTDSQLERLQEILKGVKDERLKRATIVRVDR